MLWLLFIWTTTMCSVWICLWKLIRNCNYGQTANWSRLYRARDPFVTTVPLLGALQWSVQQASFTGSPEAGKMLNWRAGRCKELNRKHKNWWPFLGMLIWKVAARSCGTLSLDIEHSRVSTWSCGAFGGDGGQEGFPHPLSYPLGVSDR